MPNPINHQKKLMFDRVISNITNECVYDVVM